MLLIAVVILRQHKYVCCVICNRSCVPVAHPTTPGAYADILGCDVHIRDDDKRLLLRRFFDIPSLIG